MLDGLYYCPHHPDRGFPGEVEELKIECACRKPGTDLVLRAAANLNIDLSRSVFIGDSTADLETGKRLGLRAVLVETGNAGADGKFPAQADARFSDVAEAVRAILGE